MAQRLFNGCVLHFPVMHPDSGGGLCRPGVLGNGSCRNCGNPLAMLKRAFPRHTASNDLLKRHISTLSPIFHAASRIYLPFPFHLPVSCFFPSLIPFLFYFSTFSTFFFCSQNLSPSLVLPFCSPPSSIQQTDTNVNRFMSRCLPQLVRYQQFVMGSSGSTKIYCGFRQKQRLLDQMAETNVLTWTLFHTSSAWFLLFLTIQRVCVKPDAIHFKPNHSVLNWNFTKPYCLAYSDPSHVDPVLQDARSTASCSLL